MKRLRDNLTRRSALYYLCWRAMRSSRPVTLRLRASKLRIRVAPAPSTDLSTAFELFVDEIYAPARESQRAQDVARVLDLGANVGFSALYFATTFPKAKIVALEPNPRNLKRLEENVAINALQARIEIVAAAATTQDGAVSFSDSENTSAITASPSAFRVKAVDVFPYLRSVDVLKMDIEGGEYSILADARFSDARPRFIIMEWHGTHESVKGERWCQSRLEGLGYTVTLGPATEVDGLTVGMLWASLA